MRKTLTVLVFALTAAGSSLALAATPKKAAVGDDDPKLSAKDDCALQRARKKNAVCEIAIEADEVEGTVFGPNGERVTGWQAVEHPSLIRYRTDFVDRITGSAEQH